MDELSGFVVRWPADDAALNPRLVHELCGQAVCDVEEGDELSVLAATAREHYNYGCPGEAYEQVLAEIRATPGTPPGNVAECGTCGFRWDDTIVTSLTPAPAARCPNEYNHAEED